MRRIGLLGGTSWESTAHYYAGLNRGAAQRLGGFHSADLVLRYRTVDGSADAGADYVAASGRISAGAR